MNQYLKSLELIKEDLGEERYRSACATALAIYYSKQTDNRQEVANKTNRQLESRGCKGYTYKFFRKFV
ncbi:hypothetical protein NDK43_06795 [Neobacillus pocheonensis]|uniref:Uncharacterized protein n=1 Tax=Neobacillus pocheonensis TaxID=363869 RepID=A0ABT0W768_9BACI|nr:hypothetical protein [Neobacillus pocheonensis]